MKWSRLAAPAVLCLATGLATPAVAEESPEMKDAVLSDAEDHLQNRNTALRTAAIVILGHGGVDEQREAWESFRHEDDEDELIAAAAALIAIGDGDGQSFAIEQLAEASSTYESLHTMSDYVGRANVAPLIDGLLDSEEAGVRAKEDALQMALYPGQDASLAHDRLTSNDEDLQQKAFQAVARSASAESLDRVSTLVGGADDSVALQALTITDSLVGRSDLREDLVDVLSTAADHSHSGVRAEAARQLLDLGEDKGTETFVDLVVDADPEQRLEYLETVLEYRNIRADRERLMPIIEDLKLQDDDERVEELQKLYEFAATDADGELFERLNEYFSSTTFSERITAARALGRTERPAAVDIMIRGLGEGRSDMRYYSARSLGHLADTDSLGDLRSQLTSEGDKEVKLELINAVGQIRDAQSVSVLRFLTRDRDADIRMAVVEALEEIGLPESVRTLEGLAGDRDQDVQWRTFMALLKLDPDVAANHVSAALRSPPQTFAQDINLHDLSEQGRELFVDSLLGHDRHRIQRSGVDMLLNHPDYFEGKASDMLFSGDIEGDVRADFVRMVTAEDGSDALERVAQVVLNHHDDSAGLVAAWILLHEGDEEHYEEAFMPIVETEDRQAYSDLMRMLAMYAVATADD